MSIGRKTIEKSSMTTCRQCGGQGNIVRMMRMGPMVQQIQQTCDSCSGAGHSYKSVQKTEVLEVSLRSQFVRMLWFTYLVAFEEKIRVLLFIAHCRDKEVPLG